MNNKINLNNLIINKNIEGKNIALFFEVLSRVKKLGHFDTIFSFSKLKEIDDSGNYPYTYKDFWAHSKDAAAKDFLAIYYIDESEDNLSLISLFKGIVLDYKKECMTFFVNEKASAIIDELTASFKKGDVLAFNYFINIRSLYAKQLFRLLNKQKESKNLTIEINEFRRVLNIPEKYQMSNIDQRVLTPSILELKKYFIGLTVKKIYMKQANKIELLEFTFDKLNTNNLY
ncbi:replication initiation protein [Vagococcus fessus]|uniref:replication initiation protein n=1 Tax=Vagococcus fessus TaxID=120370 RepID=UPI0039EB8133